MSIFTSRLKRVYSILKESPLSRRLVDVESGCVSFKLFVWAIGLLATLMVANIGWTFTQLNMMHSQVEAAQKQNTDQMQRVNEANRRIELDLVEIRTNLAWVRSTLEEHDRATRPK